MRNMFSFPSINAWKSNDKGSVGHMLPNRKGNRCSNNQKGDLAHGVVCRMLPGRPYLFRGIQENHEKALRQASRISILFILVNENIFHIITVFLPPCFVAVTLCITGYTAVPAPRKTTKILVLITEYVSVHEYTCLTANRLARCPRSFGVL